MELYLQLGHGMQQHCRDLLKGWGGGTVILSPRDLTHAQLSTLARDVAGINNARCLLDPQFYLPRADHGRLCAHDYWPEAYSTASFFESAGLRTLIEKLVALNEQLKCDHVILPGILASQVDEDWLTVHQMILDEGRRQVGTKVCLTLALSDAAVRADDQMAELATAIEEWAAPAYYLVFQHPTNNYLVEDPYWLVNVLDTIATIRLSGAYAIVGYCNHQMLSAAAVDANAIASGTYMNVRSFHPDRFRAASETDVRQRSVWYYCPQALSEYTLPFLDLAMKGSVLALMAPTYPAVDRSVLALFANGQPTAVNLPEAKAFRHYLQALHHQAADVARPSFDETMHRQEEILRDAETLLTMLRGSGVRGQFRDFGGQRQQLVGALEATRSALTLLTKTRGPLLRRNWQELREHTL